jgi:hypothetical protein
MLRRVGAIIVAVAKQQILHIVSVCLKPWLSSMSCACVILSSVAFPARQYFFPHSHKRQDFRLKKVIEHKMCFDFL